MEPDEKSEKLQKRYRIMESSCYDPFYDPGESVEDTKKKYERLQNLLATEQWKEAEEETENRLLTIANREKGADVKSILEPKTMHDRYWADRLIHGSIETNIPRNDLYVIYELWEKYSKDRESFREQEASLSFWNSFKTEFETIKNEAIDLYQKHVEASRDLIENMYGRD